MSAYGTKYAEAFSQKLMKEIYDTDLYSMITNSDYQGEINAVGSVVNILNFDRVTEKTYNKTNLTADDITENNSQLVIDQYKSFYPRVYKLDQWLSFIKDPKPTIVAQMAAERKKNIDTFVFGKYADVGAGNRVGTNYTTGDVTIDSSGNVTGNGTTFTSAMVGRGFKADGHSTWYRIKTYTSATAIVIEDDLDDVSSTYSGGAIAGGSSYTIEAATKIQITASNLLQLVTNLKNKLDSTEQYGNNAVPMTDRWLVAPPDFVNLIPRATGVALHVPAVYENLVKRGMVTELLGFKVFMSNRLTGDNSDGYRILAGHPNWMTFAEKLLDVGLEDLIGNFGYAYKDLYVYGGKVTDSRRHYAAELFGYF